MRTLGLMTFMIPVGFSGAANTLLGQFIGAGKADLVRHYYRLSMAVSVFLAVFQNVILFVFKDQIMSFYTKNPEIHAEISKAWLAFNIFVIFDTT
jgi:MATE family multidrug resistance protein